MNNPHYSSTDKEKLNVPIKEWEKILPEKLFHIAFEKGTERPFTGKFWNTKEPGKYYCAVCGNLLFDSNAKFESSCGWPSFFKAAEEDAISLKEDYSFGMYRIEANCARCGAHLGHLFEDGPQPTGMRYCMNSLSLNFLPKQE